MPRRFGEHLHGRGTLFCEADTGDCEAFLSTDIDHGAARRVAHVFRCLQQAGFRDDDPWVPLRDRVSMPGVEPRPVVDIESCLAAARPGKEHVAVLLLGKAGLRLREAINLRVHDLHLAGTEPYVIIGARKCAVPADVRATLAKDVANLALQPEDWVLGWTEVELRLVIRSVGRCLGVELSPRDLRSPFALQQGVPRTAK